MRINWIAASITVGLVGSIVALLLLLNVSMHAARGIGGILLLISLVVFVGGQALNSKDPKTTE